MSERALQLPSAAATIWTALVGCGATAPVSPTSRAASHPQVVACANAAPVTTTTRAVVPFGIYSPSVADFPALAADGFTMVGPWYVPPPDRALLDAAAEHGLGVLFPVGEDNQRYQREHTLAWDEPTLRRELAAMVAEVADHDAIVAWYLMPEELRYWREDEVRYQAIAREVIRRADPRQRPIVTYQPNDRDADQLTRAMVAQDIAAKGTYASYAGHAQRRAWVGWSTDALVAAAGDRPAWVLPEMFEDPPAATVADVAAWARHDAWLGLLSGADGILVYSGWRRPGFGSFDAYRAAYGSVARELNGPAGIADVVGAAACSDHDVAIVQGPTTSVFTAAKRTERRATVTKVERVAPSGHWLWLVNSADEPVQVRVTPRFDGVLASGKDSAFVDDDGSAQSVWLSPWAVAGFVRPAAPSHEVGQQVGAP